MVRLLFVAIIVLLLTGCDITLNTQINDQISLILKFTEQELLDNNLDVAQFKNKAKFEEFVSSQIMSADDLGTEIEVYNYTKLGKQYEANLTIKPSEDLELAFQDGIALDEAQKMMEIFSSRRYQQEFSDDTIDLIGDEVRHHTLYAINGDGVVMKDKDIREYLENANWDKLNAQYVSFSQDLTFTFPQSTRFPKSKTIEMVIVSETDSPALSQLLQDTFGEKTPEVSLTQDLFSETVKVSGANQILIIYKDINIFTHTITIIFALIGFAAMIYYLTNFLFGRPSNQTYRNYQSYDDD